MGIKNKKKLGAGLAGILAFLTYYLQYEFNCSERANPTLKEYAYLRKTHTMQEGGIIP